MSLPVVLLIMGNIFGWRLVAATFYLGHQMLKDVGIESSDEIVALFPFPLGSRLKAIVKNSRHYPIHRKCMLFVWATGIVNMIIAAAGIGLIKM